MSPQNSISDGREPHEAAGGRNVGPTPASAKAGASPGLTWSTYDDGALEAKPYLEINSPVGGVAGEEPAGQAIGFAKNGRAQDTLGRSIIDVIKDIPTRNAEGEVEPAVRGAAAAAKHTAAAAHAAEPSGTKPSAPTATRATTATRVTPLHFFAEAEGLAEAEVGGELAEADAIIGRDDGISCDGHGVKVSPRGADDVGGIGKTRGKGRPVIENGIAVQIPAQGDVEGRGGGRNDEGK